MKTLNYAQQKNTKIKSTQKRDSCYPQVYERGDGGKAKSRDRSRDITRTF